jgi:hypothetical protein
VITSPDSISFRLHQPTLLNTEDTPYESHENGRRPLDVDFLEGSSPISRSPDVTVLHDEPEPIPAVPPPNREEPTSDPPSSLHDPVPVPLPISNRRKYTARHPGSESRPLSEYSYHSPLNLHGAEAAARGFLPLPPSPRPLHVSRGIHHISCPSRPEASHSSSVAVSAGDVSRPRARPSTPTSVHQSTHEAPQDVQSFLKPSLSRLDPFIMTARASLPVLIRYHARAHCVP